MKLLFTICSILLLSSTGQGQLIDFAMLDTAKVYHSLEEALVSPRQVYRLDLSRERMKEIPDELFLCVNLNELILDKNKIVVIPDKISTLRHLQKLSMESNKIEVWPDALCRLTKLRELNMGDNDLARISDDVGKLKQLQILILWGNIIGHYPATLTLLSELKVLDLLHNEMNQEEQTRLSNLLPDTEIQFSTPCICTFDDE